MEEVFTSCVVVSTMTSLLRHINNKGIIHCTYMAVVRSLIHLVFMSSVLVDI